MASYRGDEVSKEERQNLIAITLAPFFVLSELIEKERVLENRAITFYEMLAAVHSCRRSEVTLGQQQISLLRLKELMNAIWVATEDTREESGRGTTATS